MREAKFNRPITIAYGLEMFEDIKQVTDEEKISIAEWMRAAAKEKLERERS
ncbi:hypothetical protein ACFL5K_03270 [Gemmatimonadota bacterium]